MRTDPGVRAEGRNPDHITRALKLGLCLLLPLGVAWFIYRSMRWRGRRLRAPLELHAFGIGSDAHPHVHTTNAGRR